MSPKAHVHIPHAIKDKHKLECTAELDNIRALEIV